MKRKIIIQGNRVHDVGYRLTLCQYAQMFRIFSFEANNSITDREDQVIIFAEGSEQQLSDFVEYVKVRQPHSALVTTITHETYDGEILPLPVFSQSLQMEQMAKSVSVLVEMRDMQKKSVDLIEQSIGMHQTSIGLQEKTIGLQEKSLEMHQTSVDLQKETIELQHTSINLQHETLKKNELMVDEMRLMRKDIVSTIHTRIDTVEQTLEDMKEAFKKLGVEI